MQLLEFGIFPESGLDEHDLAQLSGAKNPITRIPQTRQDVTVVIELAVDGGGENWYIRVRRLQCGNAFRAGQQADKFDGFRVQFFQPVNGGNG